MQGLAYLLVYVSSGSLSFGVFAVFIYLVLIVAFGWCYFRGRVFPQDESPGTSRLGGESLLPMVMKTSGLDISMVGGPLPVLPTSLSK